MKKLFSIFAIAIFSFSMAQFQRVEPAFWWKGMKNPELQILLYGKNIAQQNIELSDGIQIKDLTKVENPNYVFITINTNEINTPKFKIFLKNGKKTISTYQYELKERTPNSSLRESYTSKDVFYLIMPDRFANGDEKNDSNKSLIEKANRKSEGGRHGGDLRGIINNLDYLKNLGVTTLWLTPVCEDNEKAYTYHGYAQTDLYKIDARYGTNEEYRELSTELKKRDMKLVKDYVTNHWGVSHWLIQDLPTKDWIHWFEDGKNGFKRSNYRTNSQMNPYAADVDKKVALDGWFDTTMPDLNQSNPLVLKYLIQNAIWWIEYAQLDGYRVDTYPYNDKDGMAKWCKAITDEYPNFNIVGETWMYDPAQIAFWQKDSKVGEIENYNSNLPSVMDFMLYENLPKALQEEENWDKGMIRLYNSFASDFLFPNPKNMMVFFENHDTPRINEMFNGNPAYYKLALTIVSTVRGIPQLYYGSEIGMRGDKNKGDADIRRDFPGGWKGDVQNAFVSRTPEQNEFFDYTQKLLNWRKSKDVIHNGKTKNFSPERNVYVYFRYNDEEKVMVVINSSDKEQTIEMNRFQEMVPSSFIAKDVMKDAEVQIKDLLTIPAKSSLILEINK
ncbi:glycoside hydrolase family 13 protein [Cloacibacterium caeni]|uniref:glycoside hydrolase family 13 protein n=1 Tax=Cloacibacterium caeni TaxID=2004710 RepID=UPI001BCF07E9|nr:glycoside hydrolase family 13 protein [Cloacibacterium caeni]